ncbi:MAG: DUF3568 family protein [Planctomycetota bacterium]|jgi:hypothetical protein
MSIKEIWRLLLVAVLILTACGCGRPALIGTEAAVYSRGALYAVYDKDLNTVYAASVKALEQLEINVAEKNKDAFYAKVVGKVADGKSITIRMEPGDDKVTELRINASTLGNEDRSRAVYAKIRQNLRGYSK